MKAGFEKRSHAGKTKSTDTLDQELVRAIDAIRVALKGLEPGSRLELDHIVRAFSAIERTNRLRRQLLPVSGKSQEETVSMEAMARYRVAVAQWSNELPRIYGWLLAERSRLDSRRAHMQGVQAWVKTDRETR